MSDCERDYIELEDGDMIVCRCEEITKQEIIDAIHEGYVTVHDVRKRTRSGMGFCQGKTCGRLIQQLINQYANIPIEELEPARVRPPVRPLAIEALTKGADKPCEKQQK